MKTLAAVICMVFTFLFSGVVLAHDPSQHVSDANLLGFGINDNGGGLYIYRNTISCKKPITLKRPTVSDTILAIRSRLRKQSGDMSS